MLDEERAAHLRDERRRAAQHEERVAAQHLAILPPAGALEHLAQALGHRDRPRVDARLVPKHMLEVELPEDELAVDLADHDVVLVPVADADDVARDERARDRAQDRVGALAGLGERRLERVEVEVARGRRVADELEEAGETGP